MSTRFSDLRKGVNNTITGQWLGVLSDIEIDETSGKITAIVVHGEPKYFGVMGAEPDAIIPWSRIQRIGPQAIFVDVYI